MAMSGPKSLASMFSYYVFVRTQSLRTEYVKVQRTERLWQRRKIKKTHRYM